MLFREIDLVGDPRLRIDLQKEVVCYATSVIHQDWPAMGEREISNVPTYWGARLRESGVRLVRTPNESTAGKQILIAAEVHGTLPCDSSGLPTDAPGFREATAPLG